LESEENKYIYVGKFGLIGSMFVLICWICFSFFNWPFKREK